MKRLGRKISDARRLTARELRELRALRPHVGARRAVAERVRWNLELGAVPVRLAELEAALEEVEGQLASANAQLVTAHARIEAAEVAAGVLAADAGRSVRGVARAALLDSVTATTAWVAALPRSDTLISVILPTRNRAALLRDAIDSVEAQTHAAWELIVVDDGSDDETPAVLAAIDDPRVRVVRRRDAPSPSSARNAGLAAARGDLIAYLDDDNVMRPDWLRAVAWEFDRHPQVDVAYGALLLEDPGSGAPTVMLEPWSRARLAIETLVDQNVIAHRAGLSEARFDEQLDAGEDWDLMLRVTADRDPACVPVLAVLYRSDAPGRMSMRADAPRVRAAVRRSALRQRRLRILGVGGLAHLTNDDLTVAQDRGAQVAWCGSRRPTPNAADDHVFADVGEAMNAFQPDLLYLHCEQFAALPLREIERLDLPFAVRADASSDSPEPAWGLGAHRLCVGVWSADAERAPGVFLDELICGLQRVHLALTGLPPLPGWGATGEVEAGALRSRSPQVVVEGPR